MEFNNGFKLRTECLKRNNQMEINLLERESSFEMIDTLGHESYGVVYRMCHLETNET